MTAINQAWSISRAHMDAEASSLSLSSPQSQSYINLFRYPLLTKVSPQALQLLFMFMLLIIRALLIAAHHSVTGLCLSLWFHSLHKFIPNNYANSAVFCLVLQTVTQSAHWVAPQVAVVINVQLLLLELIVRVEVDVKSKAEVVQEQKEKQTWAQQQKQKCKLEWWESRCGQ